jgi:Arc/MetJ-type ribon-helix-helix transcriptional regulator
LKQLCFITIAYCKSTSNHAQSLGISTLLDALRPSRLAVLVAQYIDSAGFAADCHQLRQSEKSTRMTIHLNPRQEAFVQEALRSGRYSTVDEFLDEALSAWKKDASVDLQKAQAAAARIRELRQGVTLGDLKIKDLIAEGRR